MFIPKNNRVKYRNVIAYKVLTEFNALPDEGEEFKVRVEIFTKNTYIDDWKSFITNITCAFKNANNGNEQCWVSKKSTDFLKAIIKAHIPSCHYFFEEIFDDFLVDLEHTILEELLF